MQPKAGEKVLVIDDQFFSHENYRKLFIRHCKGIPAIVESTSQTNGTFWVLVRWELPGPEGQIEYYKANLPSQAFALMEL